MALEVYETAEDAQAALADKLVRVIEETQGEVRLALGGGRTPAPAYARLRDTLGAHDTDRSRIRVFVTDDSAAGCPNERMIRATLCDPLGLHCTGTSDFLQYQSDDLRDQSPLLHAAVLGLGVDGHTAALFAAADIASDDCVLHTTSPTREERMSLGLIVLAQARSTFLIATGDDKSAAVEAIFCGAEASGAVVARWPQTICLVDAAAGSRLLATESTK